MMDLLAGEKLVKKDKTEVTAEEALKDKELIAFYFSAHWCPPCRAFTPVLADFYEETSDKPIEIVFVSSDRSEDALFDYMQNSHGDWLAVPYGTALVDKLKQHFNIHGIPCLVVVKKNGNIVTTNARTDVERKGPAAIKDWLSN